jgi:large subunit ribosomal protein L10
VPKKVGLYLVKEAESRLPRYAEKGIILVSFSRYPLRLFYLRRCYFLLTKERKKSLIDNFIDALESSPVILFIDFTGMSVAETNDFRIELYKNFEKDIVYTVYRTSLLKTAVKLAAKELENFEKFFEGSTGVIHAEESDPIEVLKVVKKFSDSHDNKPFIKGGVLEGKIFDSAQAEEYAKLPSKQELYATVVRSLNNPISGLVNALSDNLNKLVYVFNAIKEKK